MPPPDLNITLPWSTGALPGVGGALRLAPEHFIVEEIPLYEALGEGPHLYINLTKQHLTTKEVQQRLEGLLGLSRGSVGFAGMKDKYARTTQTFSIPIHTPPAQDDALVARVAGALPVTINWARRHRNKLKAGHLLGNRFRITITDLPLAPDEALARAQAVAAALAAVGAPNYFGPQRFGGEGDNAVTGYELLTGSRSMRDRWLRQFLVSSYQSHLCNLYLARRVERGAFTHLWLGDIAKKHATGGIFDVTDLEAEQPRFDAREISFTAPMFGNKMRRALGEAALLEHEIEAETGLTDVNWRKMHTEGTRRMGRLFADELVVSVHALGLEVAFALPKGAFATTLLREFMKDQSTVLPPEETESFD
jgi:tRNA pseudouridine13 synthase